MQKSIMQKFKRYFMWFILGVVLVIVGEVLSYFPVPSWVFYFVGVIYICGLAFLIVALIFKMMLLHAMYKRIYENKEDIGPGKAVGFLFIPAFNIYWIFFAYGSLIGRIKKYLQKYTIDHRMGACKWIAVLSILLMWAGPITSFVFGDVFEIISLIGAFLMVFYLYKCAKAIEKIEQFQKIQ